jgi:hypothetical protein
VFKCEWLGGSGWATNELKKQYEMLNSSYQAHMEGMAKQAEAAVMERAGMVLFGLFLPFRLHDDFYNIHECG